MIPHRIHQLWIGPDPRPADWMETWIDRHPGWGYHLWTEVNLPKLANQSVFEAYYNVGHYSGASDVVRAELLLRYGGVWADADSKCLHTLDGAPFMQGSMFACEPFDPERGARMLTSFLGAERDHPAIARWVGLIGQVDGLILPAWRNVGAVPLGRAIGDDPSVVRLPASTFFHETSRGVPIPKVGIRYAEHYYEGTVRP